MINLTVGEERKEVKTKLSNVSLNKVKNTQNMLKNFEGSPKKIQSNVSITG